jgi:hypothetical protein
MYCELCIRRRLGSLRGNTVASKRVVRHCAGAMAIIHAYNR